VIQISTKGKITNANQFAFFDEGVVF